MKRAVLLVVVLMVAGWASAAQQSRWTPAKALSGDFSGDGNATFNTTLGGVFQVNNSPVSFGSWNDNEVGNLTPPPTLTDYRTWTLVDASGTIPLREVSNTWGGMQTFTNGPAFSDYSSAQHDHADADDGGTLPAGAIVSGTVARARLPAELAYEDETNTFALRQVYDAGFTAGANAYFTALAQFNSTLAAQTFAYVGQALQVNGTFSARANSYLEGPAMFNGSGPTFQGRPVLNANILATGTAPDYFWQESDAAADGRLWSYQTQGGAMHFRVVNDAESAANDWLVVTRSGATPTAVYYPVVVQTNSTLTMKGALDHDGSTAGFYGVTPVSRQVLSDSSGGSIGSSCPAITAGLTYAQADMQAVRNCIASLLDKLHDLGLVAPS